MPIDEIDELERLVIERIQQALLGKIPELVMSLYRAIDRWCSKKEDPARYDWIFVPSFVKSISENEKEKIRLPLDKDIQMEPEEFVKFL